MRLTSVFAAVTTTAAAGSAQDVLSTFATSHEGWRVFNFSYTAHIASPGAAMDAPFDGTDGQPPGSLRVGDLVPETAVSAPAAFVGDKSGYYGGELRYEIRIRYSDGVSYPSVMLRSSTKTLFYNAPSPPLDVWTARSVSLTAPGWTVDSWQGVPATPADMLGVLGALEHIWINTEWRTGPDDTGVDNVRLVDPTPPVPAVYCTSGTTTNGCAAVAGASANPSVSLAHACVVSATNVAGQKSGILFYGLAPTASVWCSGGSSWLCVKAPTQRATTQGSGGTSGQCDGALALDWNAFMSANPAALGQPWTSGARAYVQAWFRDPPNCKTTALSNAVELTYEP